jgi:hypothetical protein
LGEWDLSTDVLTEIERNEAANDELRAQALYWIGFAQYRRAAAEVEGGTAEARETAGWEGSLPTFRLVLERYPDAAWARQVKELIDNYEFNQNLKQSRGKRAQGPRRSPPVSPTVPAGADDF